jgi:putative transposase
MRPAREIYSKSEETYFVSSQTMERRPLFRHERWVLLMREVIEHYRGNCYQLHAYVIMPDHFHMILTPRLTLERAMQNIKGGFSFREKRAFNWNGDVWQVGYSDHRIRNAADWDQHMEYIRSNPVRARLAKDYAFIALELDPIPQRLKPLMATHSVGGAEAPPLQRANARLKQRSSTARLDCSVASRLDQAGAVRGDQASAVPLDRAVASRPDQAGAVRGDQASAVPLDRAVASRLDQAGAVRCNQVAAVPLDQADAARRDQVAASPLQGKAGYLLYRTEQ